MYATAPARHPGGDNIIQLFPRPVHRAAGARRRPRQPSRQLVSAVPPTGAQVAWLARGLDRGNGNLPLFDRYGQVVDVRTIRACVRRGWAEPAFVKLETPGWLICKLTEKGRVLVDEAARAAG